MQGAAMEAFSWVATNQPSIGETLRRYRIFCKGWVGRGGGGSSPLGALKLSQLRLDKP